MERKAVTNKKVKNKKTDKKSTINNKTFKKLDTKKATKKTNNVKNKKAKDNNKKTKKYKIKKLKSQKQKKEKKRAIKLVITFFLIGVFICCIYLALTLDIFNVKVYEITGTKKYSNEEVLESLTLNENENIFIQFFKIKTTKKINLPYIADFDLSIELPDKILINLEDREPFYMVYDKNNNQYYKLSEDGYILEESSIEKKDNNELLLYGILFNNKVTLGEKINELDLVKIKLYKKIEVEYIKSNINSVITKVNFENSLTTITLDGKLNVVLPNDTNLKYNINFLKPIIEKLGKDSAGIIDMTKTNPTFSGF